MTFLKKALALFACLVIAPPAWSDWVNLGGAEVAPNIAEIVVREDGVLVRLEVFVGDLRHFLDLVPGEWLASGDVTPEADDLRIERFAREGLTIRAESGEPLQAELVTLERRMRVDRASPAAGTVDPYSGLTLPAPPDDPRVLFVELFYSFDDTQPQVLTIAPPLGANGEALATIGMVVFHNSVPVIDFRFLSAPATLRLDWDDPWNSRFGNPNLTRHHAYPRMTFLYAEPYEVRHEALIRVRDAAELVGRDHAGETLSTEDALMLASEAASALETKTRLFVEDEQVTRDLDRTSFLRIGMRGLEILPPDTPVDVDADILGLIWSTPMDGLPKNARLEWDWFDAAAPEIAGYAIDAAGPFISPITPDDPAIVWTNHFKVSPYPEVAEIRLQSPGGSAFTRYLLIGLAMAAAGLVVSMVAGKVTRRAALAGLSCLAVTAAVALIVSARSAKQPPNLDTEQLATLTGDLLQNVYRAFDFRLEDQVYDRLALTLDGDILEQVYLDQRQALRIERAGGAEARVEKLDVVSVASLDGSSNGSINVKANWNVLGAVGHWGHVHRRANAYEADLSLAPVDGAWKIVGFDVISQDRLQ